MNGSTVYLRVQVDLLIRRKLIRQGSTDGVMQNLQTETLSGQNGGFFWD